jgi:hypothetical protein
VIYDPAIPPNLDDGLQDSITAMEWGVSGVPSSFLINPQGVIVANQVRGSRLEEMLNHFLREQHPLVSLRASHKLNPDGSVTVIADVLNPGREPVLVELYLYQVVRELDPATNKASYKAVNAYKPETSMVIPIGEFNQGRHEFNIPFNENWNAMLYCLSAVIPGTENSKSTGYDNPGLRIETPFVQAVYIPAKK